MNPALVGATIRVARSRWFRWLLAAAALCSPVGIMLLLALLVLGAGVPRGAATAAAPAGCGPVGAPAGAVGSGPVPGTAAVEAAFPGVKGSTYPGHQPSEELARDFMVDTPTGERLAAWAQANATGLGLDYVIWRQRIWSVARSGQGWRPMADRGSPTQNHMDHVHISWPTGVSTVRAAAPAAPAAQGGQPVSIPGVTAEGVQIAQTAIAVSKATGTHPLGTKVMLMSGLQESGLRNLPGGDRDSVGWQQQRPSQGWGTVEQIRDPALAAQAFLGVAAHTSNAGLTDIPDWQAKAAADPGAVAQTVQHSALPGAYAKWEPLATQILTALDGLTPVALCPNQDPAEQPASGGGPPVAGAWARPMGSAAVVTSEYGHISAKRSGPHQGMDFSEGTADGPAIYSVGPGTVTHTGPGPRGWSGTYVTVDHGGGIVSLYGHLSAVAPGITPGTPVQGGTRVGSQGQTGNSYGSHLHLQIEINEQHTDPRPFLTARGVQP